MQITGYMNIYRSGYFHRAGKPLAFDRHAGDVYPTEEAAISEIEPRSHYIATVPVVWQEAVMPHVNAADSQPISLKLTRYPQEVAHAA